MTIELIKNINTILVLLFCALSAYQYIYPRFLAFALSPLYGVKAASLWRVDLRAQ